MPYLLKIYTSRIHQSEYNSNALLDQIPFDKNKTKLDTIVLTKLTKLYLLELF